MRRNQRPLSVDSRAGARAARHSPCAIETLEQRLVLTAYSVDLGTNLDGLADWATISPFNDLATLFRRWGSTSKPYEADPSIPLTADNYPLANAGAMTYASAYPDGTYDVSYDGAGTVTFSGMSANYVVTSHEGDHWTGQLTIQKDASGGGILEIRITNIDTSNPIRNLHILSPDRNVSISNTFRPVFLDKIAAFDGPLRMMDWTQTNDNQQVLWSDRALTSRFSYCSGTGIPYESVIELANLTGKDLYINVPYHASDEFIRQMARMFRDNLNPNLKLYVEYSNEVWNPGFEQMRANQAAARDDTTFTKTDDFGRQAQLFGKLTGKAATLFQEEFGAADYASRVRFELGGLIASTYWAQTALESINTFYGSPQNLIYGVAVAPYVGVPSDMAGIDNANLTLTKLFDWMNGFIDGQITTWLRQHKSVVDNYSLKLDTYEAGQSLQYLNNLNATIKTQAQDDPRMGDVYKRLITVFTRESAGGMFQNFTIATAWGPFGFWGLLQRIDQTTSVKYAAVTSMTGATVLSSDEYAPPVAHAGGPYYVNEGAAHTLNGLTSSEPAVGHSLTYAWDLDGDGNFAETGASATRGDEIGASPTFLSAGLVGGTTHTIGLRITSSTGRTATTTTPLYIVNTAPSVTGVVTNDGLAQRSRVNSMTVNFDWPIARLDAGAFALTRKTGGTVAVTPAISADGKSVVLTFSGAGVTADSLDDGTYTLIMYRTRVWDAADHNASVDYILNFHRLFGDASGDARVDAADLRVFRTAVGSTLGSANYRWYFDYNGNNSVDAADYQEAVKRNGVSYVYRPATIVSAAPAGSLAVTDSPLLDQTRSTVLS